MMTVASAARSSNGAPSMYSSHSASSTKSWHMREGSAMPWRPGPASRSDATLMGSNSG